MCVCARTLVKQILLMVLLMYHYRCQILLKLWQLIYVRRKDGASILVQSSQTILWSIETQRWTHKIPKWFCYHPPFFVTAEPWAITHLSAWIWHVLWHNVRCQEPSPHWVRNNTYTILIMLLMAFQHCSHQLYLKTRVEDQSKYICADCEEDLLKCAGRIAHAKVCVCLSVTLRT